MDKSANNLVCICPAHYRSLILADLAASTIYVPLISSPNLPTPRPAGSAPFRYRHVLHANKREAPAIPA